MGADSKSQSPDREFEASSRNQWTVSKSPSPHVLGLVGRFYVFKRSNNGGPVGASIAV